MKDARSLKHIRWTIRRARRSLLVASCATAALLAACGGSESPSGPGTTPPPAASPAGSYTIQTVNGKSLPVALFADGSYTYEVTTGSLTLGSDGKYSVVTSYRQTVPGNVEVFVDSTGGTWTLSGGTVQFTNSQDNSTDSAAWANGLLTFAELDATTKVTTMYVYAKK